MREIVEKRNLRSKTFDRGGDKRLLRIGIRKPLHFLNEDGALQDIEVVVSWQDGRQRRRIALASVVEGLAP